MHYQNDSDFLHIIINEINKKLDNYEIEEKIHLEFDEENRKDYIEMIRSQNGTIYNKIISEKDAKKQDQYIKQFFYQKGWRKDIKNTEEIAIELNRICIENKFAGIVIFLEEFYHYFICQNDDDKAKIATYLQNLGFEIQNRLRIAFLPISQANLFKESPEIQKIERRFTAIAISHIESKRIIHERMLPQINKEFN